MTISAFAKATDGQVRLTFEELRFPPPTTIHHKQITIND